MQAFVPKRVIFSHPTSWLRLTVSGRTPGAVQLSTMLSAATSRKWEQYWNHDYFEIALCRNGDPIADVYVTAFSHRLDMQAADAGATFAFIDGYTIAIEVSGFGVELHFRPGKAYSRHWRDRHGVATLLDYGGHAHMQFKAGDGATVNIAPASLDRDDVPKAPSLSVTISAQEHNRFTVAMRFYAYESAWTEPVPAMERVIQLREAEATEWHAKRLPVPPEYAHAADVAWHCVWVATKPPTGQLTRRTVLAGSFMFTAAFGWDSCFAALAVAHADPELAFDQLRLFFDHQQPNGALADDISDVMVKPLFTKPPVQGWALAKLINQLGADRCRAFIREAYDPLARWTQWWYAFRDTDGDGVCSYMDGNDSGWDNSTVFDQGTPIESADLSAHLTLQLEALAQMAALLDRPDDARKWREAAQRQLEAMIAHCWRIDRFVSPRETFHSVEPSQSLLECIPVVLGSRLPRDVLEALIKRLSPGGEFFGEFGYATEALDSPKHESDGYWRGPIWAPSTYLLFDGLVHAGATDLAKKVARSFCDLVSRDPELGFWENYDAKSGKGLRAPSINWTPAVFLLMANWLARNV